MPMRLEAQRTLAELDASDDTFCSPVERKLTLKPRKPRISRKGIACPHKGIPTGAKASYTKEQYRSIRMSFTGTYADRDRLLFALDTSQGWRASEVCDLRWSDVLMPDSITFKPSVVYNSTRQKGGWPKPPDWTPPAPKTTNCPDGCNCRPCKLRRGEITPKPRRPPDTRDVPLSPQLHGLADLRGADLRGVLLMMGSDFHEVDLSQANLEGTDLSRVDLEGVNFREANLHKAFLRGADLHEVDLREANLREADLREVDLREADLSGADLRGADLRDAFLRGADLSGADFSGADLRAADLGEANLRRVNLSRANLSRVCLETAILVETDLEGANLSDCRVYGISAWNINVSGTQQSDLVITPEHEPMITVDNLEVAQFIYLLLHNEKIREVIDTIGKKGVLILGRFAGERKAVLDALRTALRQRNFLPIVFDFEKPTQRDFTETIMILAGMSLFVIADITNARSAPLELQATVLDYMIPFVPIIAEGEPPFSMFRDLQIKHDWVLDVLTYDTIDHLVAGLQDAVIAPALQKHEELVQQRARAVGTRHIQQYLPPGDAHP
jgi:uncharacterized protein YjbI with pentapeptide repeats